MVSYSRSGDGRRGVEPHRPHDRQGDAGLHDDLLPQEGVVHCEGRLRARRELPEVEEEELVLRWVVRNLIGTNIDATDPYAKGASKSRDTCQTLLHLVCLTVLSTKYIFFFRVVVMLLACVRACVRKCVSA